MIDDRSGFIFGGSNFGFIAFHKFEIAIVGMSRRDRGECEHQNETVSDNVLHDLSHLRTMIGSTVNCSVTLDKRLSIFCASHYISKEFRMRISERDDNFCEGEFLWR